MLAGQAKTKPLFPHGVVALVHQTQEPHPGGENSGRGHRAASGMLSVRIRLGFAGQIIETGTTSYRLAHARKRGRTTEQ